MTNGSARWQVVIMENSGKDLTDYQVRVEVTDPDFFNVCVDQKYVEFYDADGTTLLSHYTEEFDLANNKAVFWVKVPLIPANSTKTIYLNVNPHRTEDLSDPEAVFDFFDDFEGDSLDISKWSEVGSPSYSVANGILTLTTAARGEGLKSVLDHGQYVIELKEKWVSGTYFEMGPATCYQDQSNFYATFVSDWDDTFRLIRFVNGSGARLADTTYAPVTGRWVTLKLIVQDLSTGSFKAILDDEAGNHLELTGSNTELTTGKIGIVCLSDSSETVDIDYFRVRKYADPEPTVIVAKTGATPTFELKKMIANCLAGKKAQILSAMPKIRLYSGGSLIKEITATDKHVKVDEANKRYIAMFLFMDESSDEYTTDSQELVFPHPDGDYVAFMQSQSFSKTATEPLPLRWEIYLPYTVDELDGQIL